ncbi:MAG: hypothetical protein MUQ30_01985, partial [Anaerolineae bacterium]|nr:hypothetical protein [Anaerolineae bacterium]
SKKAPCAGAHHAGRKCSAMWGLKAWLRALGLPRARCFVCVGQARQVSPGQNAGVVSGVSATNWVGVTQ